MREQKSELLKKLPHGAAAQIKRATGLSRTIVDRVLNSYPDRGNVKIENFEAVVAAARIIILEDERRVEQAVKSLTDLTEAKELITQ